MGRPKFFFQDTPIVGLDISATGIKIMSFASKHTTVHGYGSIDLDPVKWKAELESNDDKSNYLKDNLTTLLDKNIVGSLLSKRAVVSVPTTRSYTRTFTLPASAERALEEAVVLEAEQYIPVPLSTLYIDYQVIDRNRKIITVLLSAVSKTLVDAIVRTVEAAGMTPIMIEPSIAAIGRLLTVMESGDLPSVIVDIGATTTDIAILDGGSIRVTGGTAIGGNTFTLALAKKMNIALENAYQLKSLNGLGAGPRQQAIKAALQPSLNQILAEIKKVMRYYTERISTDRKLEQLLVVGGGSDLPGIGEFFTENLVIAARVASPWQRIDFGKLEEPPKQSRAKYLTVAGAASVSPKEIWQ